MNAVAVTVSASKEPSKLLSTDGVFDQRQRVDSSIVTRNVKIIADALCHMIYGANESTLANLVEGSHGVSQVYIDAWLDFMGKQSRVAPYFTKKSPLIDMLEKVLARYTSDSQRIAFPLNADYEFFDSQPVSMSVYKVKSAMFDLFLALAIAAYLFVLHKVTKKD